MPEKSSSPNWDYALVATRVRHRREELGLTIVQLAERASVSRHTILRIEHGVPIKSSTLVKVRQALRLFTDQLTKREVESANYRVHRHQRTKWLVSIQKAAYTTTPTGDDPVHVDDPSERRRLGTIGFQPFFTAILGSELPDGGGGHALMELYSDSWVDSHYGEEFVYCLRGSVKITVGGDACLLDQGDAMAFDARTPHQYAPAVKPGPNDEPPLILLVVIARPVDREPNP